VLRTVRAYTALVGLAAIVLVIAFPTEVKNFLTGDGCRVSLKGEWAPDGPYNVARFQVVTTQKSGSFFPADYSPWLRRRTIAQGEFIRFTAELSTQGQLTIRLWRGSKDTTPLVRSTRNARNPIHLQYVCDSE